MVKNFIKNFGKKYSTLIKKETNISKSKLLQKSVLDVGTGNGTYVYSLSPHVKSIYGLDNNKKILEKARKRNRIFKYDNIRFYKMSVENIYFKRKFDIILLNNLLRFTNVYPTLNKILNIVSDEGIIVIQIPLSFKNPIDERLDENSDNFDKNLYNKEINAWLKIKELVKIFFKNYIKLYENSNEDRYIMIVNNKKKVEKLNN